MSGSDAAPDGTAGSVEELRAQAERLQQELVDLQRQSQARLVRAELKVEAVRAGMIDLDGLQLMNLADVKLNAAGEVEDAAHLMTQLRRAKPWLFGSGSSSSPVSAPPAQPPRQRMATEMSDEEYLAARTALLRDRA